VNRRTNYKRIIQGKCLISAYSTLSFILSKLHTTAVWQVLANPQLLLPRSKEAISTPLQKLPTEAKPRQKDACSFRLTLTFLSLSLPSCNPKCITGGTLFCDVGFWSLATKGTTETFMALSFFKIFDWISCHKINLTFFSKWHSYLFFLGANFCQNEKNK
jgi:hypothetical protein